MRGSGADGGDGGASVTFVVLYIYIRYGYILGWSPDLIMYVCTP